MTEEEKEAWIQDWADRITRAALDEAGICPDEVRQDRYDLANEAVAAMIHEMLEK